MNFVEFEPNEAWIQRGLDISAARLLGAAEKCSVDHECPVQHNPPGMGPEWMKCTTCDGHGWIAKGKTEKMQLTTKKTTTLTLKDLLTTALGAKLSDPTSVEITIDGETISLTPATKLDINWEVVEDLTVAKRRGGRPKMTEEQKAAKKAEKEAAKAEAEKAAGKVAKK